MTFEVGRAGSPSAACLQWINHLLVKFAGGGEERACEVGKLNPKPEQLQFFLSA